jgi:hypothetical protein
MVENGVGVIRYVLSALVPVLLDSAPHRNAGEPVERVTE